MIIRPSLMELLGVSKMQEELLEHRRNKRKIGLVPFKQYISPKPSAVVLISFVVL